MLSWHILGTLVRKKAIAGGHNWWPFSGLYKKQVRGDILVQFYTSKWHQDTTNCIKFPRKRILKVKPFTWKVCVKIVSKIIYPNYKSKGISIKSYFYTSRFTFRETCISETWCLKGDVKKKRENFCGRSICRS